jgi:hypothetical protein
MPVVELVKVGFLGFAVVIMYLAYNSLRNLVASKASPEVLMVFAREIRIFMGISILVVALGIVWEQLNPKVEVVLDVYPSDIAGYGVKVAGNSIKLPAEKTISLQDGSQIVLELVNFERRIKELEVQIEGLRTQTKDLKRAQISSASTEGERSREGGI